MDTNQPQQPAAQPPTNQAVEQTPQVIPVQPATSGGKNKILIIAAVILVILVILAGGLLYLRNTKNIESSKNIQEIVNVFDDLKKELQSTDVGASETDLSGIDKDLNSL